MQKGGMRINYLDSPGEGLEVAHDGALQLEGDGLAELVRHLRRHILGRKQNICVTRT